jgi:hypothetical protein
LVNALTTPPPPPAGSAAPATVPPTKPGLAGLVDRLRWLVRGTAPGGTASAATSSGRRDAPVRPLRRRSA